MKNGKIFGKINVIDFLVLMVIILAIAAVAVFLFMPRGGADTLIMKFRIEEVDEFVANKVNIGDELYDDTYSLDLGFVTDIELEDSISYSSQVNDDNVWTSISKEGYYSMIITGECTGTKTKLGAEIGGKKYGVGHTFVLRAGDAKLYLRVYDIDLKDTEEGEKEEENEIVNLSDVTFSLYVPEIENFIAEKITEGSAVSDISRKNELGNITSVRTDTSRSYTSDNVLASKEGYSSVTVECMGLAEVTDDGVKVNGKIYRIGDELQVSAGNVRMTVKISNIG